MAKNDNLDANSMVSNLQNIKSKEVVPVNNKDLVNQVQTNGANMNINNIGTTNSVHSKFQLQDSQQFINGALNAKGIQEDNMNNFTPEAPLENDQTFASMFKDNPLLSGNSANQNINFVTQ